MALRNTWQHLRASFLAGVGGKVKSVRTDIQALRGLAVLFVVLYHAKLSFVPAGYLGVDVFFVISGFLITKLIAGGIKNKNFSLVEFYFRRAKRLLPAAYVTLLVTTALAPLFLASQELRDFAGQMIGAVTFTANIALWRQSGYFDGAAELKPLLHMWSLAIEEQYYFVLPAMMLLVPRRFWLAITIIATAISFGLCVQYVQSKPALAFYLLPTRFWELGIGSIGALLVEQRRLDSLVKWAFWPSLALLLGLPLVATGLPHPGLVALVICIATLVVILRAHPLFDSQQRLRPLARLGDISYSLYLVHWPLFAFLWNVWAGHEPVPTWIRLAVLGIALGAAYLLNKYVEEPVRHANFSPSFGTLAKTLSTSLALVALAIGVVKGAQADTDYVQIRRSNHGFGAACASTAAFTPSEKCRTSDHPDILIWGDSYAMHLVPGIVATRGNHEIAQATMSACGPFVGLSTVERVSRAGRGVEWAKRCMAFNQSVMDYLASTPSIRYVVISSPFSNHLDSGNYLMRKVGSSFELLQPTIETVAEEMGTTAKAIRDLGKKVVIIAPPPTGGFDAGRCIERVERGMPTLGVAGDCRISVTQYHAEEKAVLKLLSEFVQKADVNVIGFDAFLCDQASCRTFIDNTLIYRDGGHLSYVGSEYLAKKTHLVEGIERQAK